MTAETASNHLQQQPAYRALHAHHREIAGAHLRDLFAADPGRGTRLTAEAAGIYLDYSKHRVTDETLRLLLELAARGRRGRAARRDVRGRAHQRHRGPRGAARRAAHAARRARSIVDGRDVVPDVHEVLDRMAAFAERVRAGEWTGHTGKPIRNVVNIGIGGSDLGPGDGVRGAAPLQQARPDVPLRLQRRRHRLRRGDARPRPRARRCSSSARRRSRRSRR